MSLSNVNNCELENDEEHNGLPDAACPDAACVETSIRPAVSHDSLKPCANIFMRSAQNSPHWKLALRYDIASSIIGQKRTPALNRRVHHLLMVS